MKNGDVVVLENLARAPGEAAGSDVFARRLAALGQVLVLQEARNKPEQAGSRRTPQAASRVLVPDLMRAQGKRVARTGAGTAELWLEPASPGEISPHVALVFAGDDARKIRSASGSVAGTVYVDWRDVVKPANKKRARATSKRVLRHTDFGNKWIYVRLNDLSTPWAAGDLLELDRGIGNLIDGIVIRGVSGPEDIERYSRFLTAIEQDRGWEAGRLKIRPFIDDPKAILLIDEIATSPRVSGLIFGLFGHLTAIRAKPGAVAEPFVHTLAAKVAVVQAARKAGILAIDGLTREVPIGRASC